MFHDGSRISANRLILDATVARLESKIESRIFPVRAEKRPERLGLFVALLN
jgi:hypothetical protein